MPPEETHPIYELRKSAQLRALTSDSEQRYFDEHWSTERTEQRKKRIDENVVRRENAYFDRIIGKIKALRHDDMPKAKKPIGIPTLALDTEKNRTQLLRLDALSYHRYLLHSFWEVKNLASVGVKEPPKGDHRKRSRWEEYNDTLRSPKSKAETAVDESRRKLSQVFDEAHTKRLNP